MNNGNAIIIGNFPESKVWKCRFECGKEMSFGEVELCEMFHLRDISGLRNVLTGADLEKLMKPKDELQCLVG